MPPSTLWVSVLSGRITSLESEREGTAKRFADLERAVVALGEQADRAAQSPGDPQDLISYLCRCDAALDCFPDGELRICFPDMGVPLDALLEAVGHLQRQVPGGKITIGYQGGVVVQILPPLKKGAT